MIQIHDICKRRKKWSTKNPVPLLIKAPTSEDNVVFNVAILFLIYVMSPSTTTSEHTLVGEHACRKTRDTLDGAFSPRVNDATASLSHTHWSEIHWQRIHYRWLGILPSDLC